MKIPPYTIPFFIPCTGCPRVDSRDRGWPWIASMAMPVTR